ncbi:hypothetical protein EHO61_02260 [Leptospira fluminis]|uniref:Lipoprotein n=1 Tax=Leptospira fluminis TaxID=2484979 RepID=A0A4R9GRD2_9LEPT|nr:hypothetical protein [Leptospira fluminis]TGK20714.1 hypothetical protein EHO61_02260 [Leptospira fluminis]
MRSLVSIVSLSLFGCAAARESLPNKPLCTTSLNRPKITIEIDRLSLIKTIPEGEDPVGSEALIRSSLYEYESYFEASFVEQAKKEGILFGDESSDLVLTFRIKDFGRVRPSSLYAGIGGSVLLGLGVAGIFSNPALGAEVLVVRALRFLTAPYVYARYVSTVTVELRVDAIHGAKNVYKTSENVIRWQKKSREESLRKDLEELSLELAKTLRKNWNKVCDKRM